MGIHYDPVLVAISYAIAVMASYVALDLTGRISTVRGWGQRGWWLGGSLAMGVGIWSMHFVGMLAFHLPVPMEYDLQLVLLSVVVAIAASGLALFVASRSSLPLRVLTASSLLMGGAINGMHYIGMAAMIVPLEIHWSASLVVLSIVIAITASFAALLLAFRLRHGVGGVFQWSRAGAAAVMGIAIVGMHYTGMAAASFGPPAVLAPTGRMTLQIEGLSVAVILSTGLILAVAIASAMIDDRMRLLASEQRARYDAEAANRLKDEFLATLSHELRTPLNVILGRARMLGDVANQSDAVYRMASSIRQNAEVLARLVEDLLDVSRITLGQIQIESSAVQLADVLDAAAYGMQAAAGAKGLRVSISAPSPLPTVMGDPVRLQQVVWNLLANAIKFTPRGGEITATVHHGDQSVVLTVADTGEGIDPSFLPYVFEMFRQGEPAMSGVRGGLGLGLSIVRRLVELHGGTVTAYSEGRGKGATFTISLPCGLGATPGVANGPATPLDNIVSGGSRP